MLAHALTTLFLCASTVVAGTADPPYPADTFVGGSFNMWSVPEAGVYTFTLDPTDT